MVLVSLPRPGTLFLVPGEPASFSRALDLPPAPLTELTALSLLEKHTILLYQQNSISSRDEGGYQIPGAEALWLVI